MKVLLDHEGHIFLQTREARKFVHGVALTRRGVKKSKVPMNELQYYRDAVFKDKPYTVSRAKRMLREIGKRLGITKEAIKELRSCP